MEKNIGWLLAILAVLLIMSSYTLGRVTGPVRTVTEKEFVDVPGETVYEDVIVEVVSSTTDTTPLLEAAIDDFMVEVEEEEDLQVCDEDEYDIDQIKVKRLYDAYTLNIDEDEHEVVFRIKLKYLDEDVEEKCYNSYDVSVFYEPEEDPVIEILE